MDDRTAKLWASQNRHEGDRFRLFDVVVQAVEAHAVLYPGSYLDVAPSSAFDHVTYVDIDKRFPKFFDDEAGVREIIDERRQSSDDYHVTAIHADYRDELPVEDESVDLLVSLYAGFISEHCTRYLKIGGSLLVNGSHGDASMASIDDRYDLAGVITARDGGYTFGTTNLDSYLITKRPDEVTVARLHELGRGIAYTKTPFAYIFSRVS